MKRASFFIAIFLAVAGVTLLATAQTPIAVRYTATTDNVGMSDSIRVELFRWSTDKERDALVDAWKLTAPAPAPVAPPPPPEPDPTAVQDPPVDNNAAAPAGRGAGGNARGGAPARGAAAGGNQRGAAPARGAAAGGNQRGGAAARGGRGGRGDGAGGDAGPARTPEGSLAAALARAETVGRIWSSEAAGYSIRYAVRLAQPDGGERIVLITDRRLNPDIWKPASGAAATNYEFTVVEARLNAKGAGEAKTSLTGKLTVDTAAGLTLDNYAALPVILKNMERR